MIMIPTLLPYQRSVELLQDYAIPLARANLVAGADQAVAAAAEIGFPVVVKLVSPSASHKSDSGLLRLNLKSAGQVRQAAKDLLGLAGEPPAGLPVEGLLVQEMVAGGMEFIVGINSDPQFGPVLLLGAGGTWVELLDEVVLRLPPLTGQGAQEMIDEIRAGRLLRGYRTQPPADAGALGRLLLQVGRLAIEQAGWVDSLDINPVLVLPAGQGVCVVDFRIYIR
jgi:acyl-CoA synthetase (NDP forming)